jgi:hypothetical protein
LGGLLEFAVTASRVPATGAQSLYFYLSHAHDVAEVQDNIDVWVEAFYRDLVREVGQRSRNRLTGQIGAYWPCAVAEGDPEGRPAMGTARAFVPLYSPAYLSDERAMAERAAFVAADGPAAQGRIVPVLWQPTAAGESAPELAEAASFSTIPEYHERGLLELRLLPQHDDAYRRVVAFLADRIVQVADGLNGRLPSALRTRVAPAGFPPLPRTRFVVTVVADDEQSEIFPLAKRLTAALERIGYHDVVIVRYPSDVDEPEPSAGIFLVEAGMLVDVSVHLRKRLLGLPDGRLVVALGAAAGSLRLEGELKGRVHVLAGKSVRVQVRANPDPIAAVVQEILGLIRRQSTGKLEARPYPRRTRLYD